MGAVVSNRAVLELAAEDTVKLLVGFPVVFQHAHQLGLDLLFQIAGNDCQLTAVLQHFPADVQGQILTVHHAPDKAEMLRKQLFTVFHDHHTGRIQLQTPLEVLGIKIKGCFSGDIQQRLEGHRTLCADMDCPQGLIEIKKLFPIEAFILLLGHILLCPLPDGYHGVEGFHSLIALILVGILFLPGLGDLHADGIADIVRVLPHQTAQSVLFQKFGILFLLRIQLQGHDHIGAGVFPLPFFNGVTVCSVRSPSPSLVLSIFFGNHSNRGRHHKRGIETHAKLADNIDIFFLFHGLLKAQRTGLGNGA